MSHELARAARSAVTGVITAVALLSSMWLATGCASRSAAQTVGGSRPACTHWTKAGPISNANSVPVLVVDRDGAVPSTLIPAHGSKSFVWTFPASVARHVDTVTVTGRVDPRPLTLTLTFTRPASCQP